MLQADAWSARPLLRREETERAEREERRSRASLRNDTQLPSHGSSLHKEENGNSYMKQYHVRCSSRLRPSPDIAAASWLS